MIIGSFDPERPPAKPVLTDALGTGRPLYVCRNCGGPWAGGSTLLCAACDRALDEVVGTPE